MIAIEKIPLFTEEVYSFIMPDHNHWGKQIKNIVLVEKNKAIHDYSTIPEEDCNVKANRTTWDTFYQIQFLILFMILLRKKILMLLN